MKMLCATRPDDWWTIPDGGNRLALMLCGVCPARLWCASQARDEAGVIRAGLAYADTGAVLPLCGCGYPQVDYRGGRVWPCRWCTGRHPRAQAPPRRVSGHVVDEGVVDRLMRGLPVRARLVDRRTAIHRMLQQGVDRREIADRLGVQVRAVHQAVYRAQKKADPPGYPVHRRPA